jgi:hypothetical protein
MGACGKTFQRRLLVLRMGDTDYDRVNMILLYQFFGRLP